MSPKPVIFISYAHRDPEDRRTAEKFEIFLRNPAAGLAEVFFDRSSIEPNDEIDPVIKDALDRTAAAVLVVSSDFVNSHYISTIELPAIFDRFNQDLCKCWPINNRPAVLRNHPFLDGRKLIPPKPTPLIDCDQGKQEAAMVMVTEQILDHLESMDRVPPPVVVDSGDGFDAWNSMERVDPAVDPEPAPEPVPLIATDTVGQLHGVPPMPSRYVVRQAELDGIVADLHASQTSAVANPATANDGTGASGRVGLFGIGGAGKTVLAAAVCHNELVRSHFPDGVFWVTAGEHADPVSVQTELAVLLGASPRFGNVIDGRAALAEALAGRRSLVVLDDVWSAAMLDAVPAPAEGRLLITTRNQDGVLGARPIMRRSVGALSQAEARQLFATRLDAAVDRLPAAVDGLITATGSNALLVDVMAAAVAHGADPAELLDRVRDEGADPHPYVAVFRTLRSAVEPLDPELRQRYLRLAVFPPDTLIPLSTLERWWHRFSDRPVDEDIDELAARSLLTLDADAGAVYLHDHQHDFVVYECADPPSLLHADLLETLSPASGRWGDLADDEPYLWPHLVHHLQGAGRSVDSAVVDAHYLAGRIATSGTYAAEHDLLAGEHRGPDLVDPTRRIAHLVGAASDRASAEQTLICWLPQTFSSPSCLLQPVEAWPLLQDTAEIRTLAGHNGSVTSATWSPDGTQLATTSEDGTTRIWNPTTGQTTTTLTGHTKAVTCAAWSPDGTQLATTSNDDTTRIWNPTTGQTTTTLTGHTHWVTSAAWSPDGTQLATTSWDHTTRIWNPTTGQTTTTLTGHTNTVTSAAWSPDGTQLATTSEDGTTRIWNPTTGQTTTTLTGHTNTVTSAAWSPDGTQLATTSWDDTTRIWNPTTGQTTTTLTGHTSKVTSAAWSPNGTQLATTSWDNTTRIWNPTTSQTTTTLTGHTEPVTSAAWSPDGTQLATTSEDGTTRIWNPTTSQTTTTLTGHTHWVTSAAWSPDGTQLATTSYDDTTRIWNPTTSQTTTTLTGHTSTVTSAAWSPDGTQLATTSYDNTTRIWNPTTSQTTTTLTGNTHWVTSAAWSPNGTQLATTSWDRTTRIWNPTTGQTTTTLTGTVSSAAWSPNGTQLATSNDDTTRIWDPTTGQTTTTLTGHTKAVTCAAWSPDGTQLATTSYDRTTRIWDPTTSQTTTTLTGHTNAVTSATWSPNGTQLATISDDNTTRIWNPTTGELLTTLVLDGPGRSVAYSSANQLAVAVNNRVIVLDVRV